MNTRKCMEQAGLSRATLEISSLKYESWFIGTLNAYVLCLNLSSIQLEVAEMSIHFDCYVLLPQLNVSVRSDK